MRGWANTMRIRGRAAVGAAGLAAVVLLCGCQPDTRISLDELQGLERKIADKPDVEVERTERLALTDYHPYRVRPGDVLALRLIGLNEDPYEETTLQLRVHEDGQVRLPIVGPVRVEGLDLGQVEQSLIKAHVPAVVKDLTVYVELVGPENTTVLVLGAVGLPGLVKLPQNERNVLYALASAGGFSSTSSGKVRLRPIRTDVPEEGYDLGDPNDVRRLLLRDPLEAGDMVLVEAAESSAVYVSGLVNAPGPIQIPPDSRLSFMRTLAAAGGWWTFWSRRRRRSGAGWRTVGRCA